MQYNFQTLFSTDPAGGEAEVLAPFTEYQIQCADEDGGLWHDIYQIAAAPDGTLRLLTRRLSDQSDSGWSGHVLILDSQGAVQVDYTLDDFSNPRRRALECDSKGNTCIYDSGTEQTTIITPQGQLIGTVSGELRGGLAPLADGRVAGLVLENDLAHWSVRAIDPDKQSFVNCGTIPLMVLAGQNQSFFRGSGDYDLLCASDLSLCGYKLAKEGQEGTGELLLSWLNCDIDGSGVLSVTGWDEGFACAVFSDAYGGESAIIRQQEAATGEETILSLACRNLPSRISQAVLQFNRKDNGYRVKIRDYGEASLSVGLAAGLDQMTTDLISGKTPDLFCLENLDVQTLIDQELLADLWPYIDADEELGGREALVQPLFDALTQDGKLYQVTYGFSVYTLAGRTDMVGETEGWTAEQFAAACAACDCEYWVDSYWNEKESVLSRLLMASYDQFIDRKNWTASFDSLAFIEVLECANTFPQEAREIDYREERLLQLEGQKLVTEVGIFEPHDFVSTTISQFGDVPVTLVGYPGAAGNGGLFSLETPLAICAQGANKEGAWDFLRTLLLPENQRVSDTRFLPSNKKMMDSLVAQAETKINDSEWTLNLPNGAKVPIRWEAGDTERFWEYLSGVREVQQQEDAIKAIIMDEAAQYFAGNQTAEAAAKAIQSRVNLYLGERKK